MKNTGIIIGLLFAISFSQVCNTGQTLKPSTFTLSFVPIVLVDYDNNLGLNSTFGFGLTRRIDLGFALRVVQDYSPVFGADIEFALLKSAVPNLSLTTGAHVFRGGVGIDGTINLTFVLKNIVALYGGFNIDLDFKRHRDTYIPLWGFFGTDIHLRRHVGMVIEVDLDILNNSYHIFCAGISVYF